MFQIIDYLSAAGEDPFKEWLGRLRDRQARARVALRVQRMASGNFGDFKVLAEGVSELRIDYGPGYRVYFARVGDRILLLLAGGDKRTQPSDIKTAIRYLNDWKKRACYE